MLSKGMNSSKPLSCDSVYHNWDRRRENVEVTRDERLGWVLTRHADVLDALHRPEVFSNQVSTHLSVPNGMDPPIHAPFRRLVEGFFTAERMDAFSPVCRKTAAMLVQGLTTGEPIDAMADLGLPPGMAGNLPF